MSIDGRIRSTSTLADGALLIDLEPRWDARVRRFSEVGQFQLMVEPPVTRIPEAGLKIWGNSGTVVIVQLDHSEWRYDRKGFVVLREAHP
jgi:hypothetical protein